MPNWSTSISGPLDWNLFKRFRLKTWQWGGISTACIIYATTAVEPSLSGKWTDGDRHTVSIFHFGNELRGYHFNSEEESFTANRTGQDTYSGGINLYGAAKGNKCYQKYIERTKDLKITRGNDYKTMKMTFTSGMHDKETCKLINNSRHQITKTYKRIK